MFVKAKKRSSSRFRLIACALFVLIFLTGSPCLASKSKVFQPGSKTFSRLIKVPLARQATDYTCGVAALQSVFGYWGDDIRPDKLARQLKASPQNGTSYHEIEKLAKDKGYQVKIWTNTPISLLKKLLDENKPVICLIQAWPNHPTDFALDWEDGHYVVAIGYDQKNIYFMDPSTLGNYTYIPEQEFLARWHDQEGENQLLHFAMSISKSGPTLNHNLIKPLE